MKEQTGVSLSDDFASTIRIAQAIAKENMHNEMAPAHLLKALLHKDAGLVPLLEKLGKDVYYVEEWADVRIESIPKMSPNGTINGSKILADVVSEADSIRLNLGQDDIQPVHAFAALSTPGVGFTYEQLKTFPVSRHEIITAVTNSAELQSAIGKEMASVNTEPKIKKDLHVLLKYCTDKSLLAKEGKLDIIIGRDKEIRMMGETLCRRSKPNVLIVGEPGVGKSALIDGFTLAIMHRKVSPRLFNARVFELDMGSLIAGASYKGEVEDRLKSILKEIKQYDKAILFIDEMHLLLDKQGAAAGCANLLKPELARGEVTMIGATTTDGYRLHFEADDAFNRRFELLMVEEPDAPTCFHMIKGMIHYYENYHAISVSDDNIHETIRLAKRYIKDRRLPDAAIDLADRTMASLRMINHTGTRDIAEFKKQLSDWSLDEESGRQHSLVEWQWYCRQVNQHISPILWTYVQSENDPSKMQNAGDVKAYLANALQTLEAEAAINRVEMQNADLAAVISHKTGIPIGKIQSGKKKNC